MPNETIIVHTIVNYMVYVYTTLEIIIENWGNGKEERSFCKPRFIKTWKP